MSETEHPSNVEYDPSVTIQDILGQCIEAQSTEPLETFIITALVAQSKGVEIDELAVQQAGVALIVKNMCLRGIPFDYITERLDTEDFELKIAIDGDKLELDIIFADPDGDGLVLGMNGDDGSTKIGPKE